MYKNLDDDLQILRMSGEKPNFAELARIYGCDYRTVKKHYEEGDIKKQTRNKPSTLDSLQPLIKSKMKINGITVKALYEFLVDQNMYTGTYSNLRKYIRKHELNRIKTETGHPRFETLPGYQAQADWKENLHMISRHGEIFRFNVFHIVLGYSRTSYFVYSIRKEQTDLHRCLIDSFEYFGGVPAQILFDNMPTASVHVGKYRKARINPKLEVFARNFGFDVLLCRPYASYTKGKVESRNKLIDWLKPYDGEFEDEDELKDIIQRINIKANNEICQATNEPPSLFFRTEKKYLKPLPPQSVISTFQSEHKVKVGKDSTIYYKGSRYSVRPALINEYVGYEVHDNRLYIYYKQKLETVHKITEEKRKINYKDEHYRELLRTKIKDEDDLDEAVRRNLENLDRITGDYNDI